MYQAKRFLRAINGRLWPLAFLIVLLLILIASDNHNIHTLPLAKNTLGKLHGDAASNFSTSLTEWAGWIIFVIVCLFIVRLIIGAIASDKKAFEKIEHWLRNVRDKSYLLEITKPFNAHELTVFKPYRMLEKRSGTNHKDNIRFPLKYYTLVPAETKNGKKQAAKVEITYQETAVNESWRVRDIYETLGHHPAIAPTPVILLVSRLQSARDTALLERLGTSDQFMKLEGNFSDVFEVYVPRGDELEALDLLSPDVMEILEREAPDIDIKFSNGDITCFKNGYIFDINELKEYEHKIATVVAGLDRYLGKQRRKADRKGWNAMLSPAYIKSISLITDRLLGWGFILFLLAVAGNLILNIFVKSHDLHIGDQVYTVMPHAADIGALVIYAVLALLFIIFVLGELEVGLHRLRLYFITHRARRLYKSRSSRPIK